MSQAKPSLLLPASSSIRQHALSSLLLIDRAWPARARKVATIHQPPSTDPSPIHTYALLRRYTSPHVRILIRELRVLVYAQFLESYKSVRLQSMAQAFGVSVDFIDK